MPTLRSLRSLDWLNFLLADVQTGVGPFSACVVTTQFTIALIAGQAGRLAGSWGRKPMLLIGFGVLPVRALLYTLTDKPAMLIAIQLLDGIGAGIFGVLSVLVIADLTRGTGRFNVSQGVIATAEGPRYRCRLRRVGPAIATNGRIDPGQYWTVLLRRRRAAPRRRSTPAGRGWRCGGIREMIRAPGPGAGR